MKKIYYLTFGIFFIILLFIFSPNCKAVVPDGLLGDDIIPIEDAELKKYLLSAKNYQYDENNVMVGYPIDENEDGEISVNEIENLKTITIFEVVEDYSPLKYATNLTSIWCEVAEICKLDDLATLPNLEEIRIQQEVEVNLTGISKFNNINKLNLVNCTNILNIEELGTLTNLQELMITYGNLEDISAVGNLTNLESLTIKYNNITDVSSLKNCTKLISLDLESNNITDISPLAGLTNLEQLNLSENPVSEILSINNLKQLKRLTMMNCSSLKEVNLSDLENLEYISIFYGDSIESVSIENLPNLTNLNLMTNQISNITILNTPKLEVINLTDNQISDLTFLNTDLPSLKSVHLTANHFNPLEENNAKVLETLEKNGVTVERDEYQEEVGLEFELNEEGTSYIVKGFFGPEETEVTIPSSYKGLPVTEIGEKAFYRIYGDYNLVTIILPETITKIGNLAFENCQKLENLNIPSAVVSIGYDAFLGCKTLNNIVLPQNLTVIEEGVFWGCESLTEITIPKTVTEIKSNAFYECKSLTEIVIPDSVTKLGETCETTKIGGVFAACSSLSKVTLSKNLKNIGTNMFASCLALEEITIPEGVISIDASAIFNCANLKEIVFPRSFTTLNGTIFDEYNVNPTIYGYIGSYAEELANTYEFEFVPIEELTTEETKDVEVDGETVTVMPVEKGTDISNFVNEENFPVINTYTITVYDASGNEKAETEKLGSRNIIKITNDAGDVLAEYTVIVPGDVTGNGEVKMYDSFVILKGTLFSGSLDAIETLIRDYNKDGIVKMFDAFAFLKQALFN